jgi:hypothetical protein
VRRNVIAVFLVAGLIQIALCRLPDTMADVLNYRLWVEALVCDGLTEAYWPSRPLNVSAERLQAAVDYPPVVPYLLVVVGRLHAFVGGGPALLDTLIRVPFVAAKPGARRLVVRGEAPHGR